VRDGVGTYLRLAPTDDNRKRALRRTVAAGVALAVPAVALVAFCDRPWLAPLGLAAATLALAHIGYERAGREREAVPELLGMVALSAAAPAAAYCATGTLSMQTLGLWVLAALFFCGSVFHVRYVVRRQRARAGPLGGRLRAGWQSLVYHWAALGGAAVLAATDWLPALGFAALLPAVARATGAVACRATGPTAIRRIGFAELAYAILFAAGTIAVLHVAPDGLRAQD
jgi:hypothetical protein